jgi:hypothetical protein
VVEGRARNGAWLIAMSEVTVSVQVAAATGNERIDAQRLWTDRRWVPVRGRLAQLTAHRGGRIVGLWLVPLMESPSGLAAAMLTRMLPYCAPWIGERAVLKRRQVMDALIRALQERVTRIELPMAPGFVEANAATARGCFVEWRHTHIIHRSDYRGTASFAVAARSHVRHARAVMRIDKHRRGGDFDYARAIHGSPDEVRERGQFAQTLVAHAAGLVLEGRCEGALVGGALVVYDETAAYLMHLWSARHVVRGIATCLVAEAMAWAFDEAQLALFDLEGSILAGVDTFMSGFNATITPYPYIHWAATESELLSQLHRHMAIVGRCEPAVPRATAARPSSHSIGEGTPGVE